VLASACGDDDEDAPGEQPTALVGDWDEVGYARRMALDADADLRYVNLAAGEPGTVEGRGTWEGTSDAFTIHLNSGRFRWLESVNSAPISFSFVYELDADTLALTFEVLGVASTTRYVRAD
jgi:hypothetical protein